MLQFQELEQSKKILFCHEEHVWARPLNKTLSQTYIFKDYKAMVKAQLMQSSSSSSTDVIMPT